MNRLVVGAQLDRLGDGRLAEARPARAGFELRVGAEQDGPAAGAAVVAGLLVEDVVAGEGRLRAGATQDVVLGGRELLSPLLLAPVDLPLVGSHTGHWF